MRESVRTAVLGSDPVLLEGLGRLLIVERADVRRSVDDPTPLSLQCRYVDLVIIVDEGFDHRYPGDIEMLHRRYPDLRLILLVRHFQFDFMLATFAAGAHGYLLRDMQTEPLIRSLHLVASGERVMPSCLIPELILRADIEPWSQKPTMSPMSPLSPRETEILECLVEGCPNKVISQRLAISEATVKVHVKAVLRKLHVKNRTQAAIVALHDTGDRPAATSGPAEPPTLQMIDHSLNNTRTPVDRYRQG